MRSLEAKSEGSNPPFVSFRWRVIVALVERLGRGTGGEVSMTVWYSWPSPDDIRWLCLIGYHNSDGKFQKNQYT